MIALAEPAPWVKAYLAHAKRVWGWGHSLFDPYTYRIRYWSKAALFSVGRHIS